MVFCNKKELEQKKVLKVGHNPYFNRWFSAIMLCVDYQLEEYQSQSLF